MFKAHALSAATAAVLLSGSFASAALLTSFEGAAPGSAVLGAGGTVVNTGNGITDGTQAARRTGATGSYSGIAQVQLSGVVDPSVPITTFTVDWYVENITGAGGYHNLTAAIGGAAFDQIDGDGLATTPANGVNGNPAGAYSITYNLDPSETANITTRLNAGELVKLELYANKDGAITADYTVDNIRFNGAPVPEPATGLALLGAGGLLALRRRKA